MSETEELTADDAKGMLGDAVQDFTLAVISLATSVKACRENGIQLHEMHDIIMEAVPEEDRPMMQAQWPMISMMLSAL